MLSSSVFFLLVSNQTNFVFFVGSFVRYRNLNNSLVDKNNVLSILHLNSGITFNKVTEILEPFVKMSMKVCDIEDDVKDALRQFRFRKHNNNAALILKVDREKQRICIDSLVEDTCLDDLRDILPGHQPRYVVYSNKMEHSDGRVSYPLSFIYITPQDSQRDLQVMYAGTKLALQKEADLTRVYEVRELDELTDEWLREKLSK